MKIVCDTGLSVHIYDVFVVCGVCGRLSGRGKLLEFVGGLWALKWASQTFCGRLSGRVKLFFVGV